ncbi:reverse transcriptase [Elysia marginata]|uniref:Reverse transcriptase n=1 Tax=Elysia marginata TaxID=1093978 RepID=A0AAV4GGC3_9GAST|nr:reverse transcriptase [Elysia marginata]
MQGLFLTFASQINFLQSKYASLVVNSTFNAETSRLFRSFENNSAAFNDSSLRNVRVAAELAALSKRTTNTQRASYRVPKQGGDFRLITDLRYLNKHLQSKAVLYEDIKEVLPLAKPGDQFVTRGIKNGFFHVGVHNDFTKYLGFCWRNIYYEWCVLPFGLKLSPWLFGKTLRPIAQWLTSRGLKIVCYVDDFIVLDAPENIVASKDLLLATLKRLGLIVNFEKSQLNPSYEAKYIGYIIDTNKEKGKIWIKIPKARITRLKQDIRLALKNQRISARGLAKIAGQCISMSKAVLPAKLLLRNIYRLLSSRSSWQDTLTLDPPSVRDLHWWLEAVSAWKGRSFHSESKEMIQIATDASSLGWGGTIIGSCMEAQGAWDFQTSAKSSNYRELTAVYPTLHSFLPIIRDKTVTIFSDNITTVANINLMGSSHKDLSDIKKIWGLALRNSIAVQARYLPGKANSHTDYLSRLPQKYEWILHPHIFAFLNNLYGPHSTDWFASMSTTHCAAYNSLYLDPYTSGVDALEQADWDIHNNFVNPPFRLLTKVLSLIFLSGIARATRDGPLLLNNVIWDSPCNLGWTALQFDTLYGLDQSFFIFLETRESFQHATRILIEDHFQRFEDEQICSNQPITFSQELFTNTEEARLDSSQTPNDYDYSQDLFDDTDTRLNNSQAQRECAMNTQDFVQYILDCSPEPLEPTVLSESVATGNTLVSSPSISPSVSDPVGGEKNSSSEEKMMRILIEDRFQRFEDEQICSNQPITFFQELFTNTEEVRLGSSQTPNDYDYSQNLFDDTDTRLNNSQAQRECAMNTQDFVQYILDCSPEPLEPTVLSESVATGNTLVSSPSVSPSVSDPVGGEKNSSSEDDEVEKDEEARDPNYNPSGANEEVSAIKKRDKRDRRSRTGIEGPKLPRNDQRKYTRQDSLPNSTALSTVVCKTFFLETFQISNGRLSRALKTVATHNGPRADQRGRKEPKNKTPVHLIEELKNFMDSFRKYESHYCRVAGQCVPTGKKYFSVGLNTATLYKMYNEDCVSNFRQVVSQQVFRKTLKKGFRIGFHQPLKDTCKTCDKYKVQIAAELDREKVEALKAERDAHHIKAEQVTEQINKDKLKENTKVICFDLQKTMPTPVLTTNLVYYKRQLWTFNLGIHDENTGTAYMFMWHEGQASRGPNEIGSCLLR